MPLRIVVTGVAGRMGREVVSAVVQHPELTLIGGVVRPGSGTTVPGLRVSERLEDLLPEADVVVDFTTPEAAVGYARACAGVGRPFVSGTTGLDANQAAALADCAAAIPVFYARNLSLGLAVLLGVVPEVAAALTGYDVEIVETHHRHKADAPSGTALALAEAVAAVSGAALPDDAVFGRHGYAPRRPGEIGLHAVRAGGNPGEHIVVLADEGEEVRVAHRAYSRRPYADGALRAARFVAGRPAGLYGMNDLLAERRTIDAGW